MGDMRRQYMQRVCDHLQALGMRADLGDPRVRLATRGWVGLCEIATADWLSHGGAPWMRTWSAEPWKARRCRE